MGTLYYQLLYCISVQNNILLLNSYNMIHDMIKIAWFEQWFLFIIATSDICVTDMHDRCHNPWYLWYLQNPWDHELTHSNILLHVFESVLLPILNHFYIYLRLHLFSIYAQEVRQLTNIDMLSYVPIHDTGTVKLWKSASLFSTSCFTLTHVLTICSSSKLVLAWIFTENG